MHLLLLVAVINIIAIVVSYGLTYDREWVWQRAWMIACFMFTVQDIILNQTSLAFLLGYILPRSMSTQLYAAQGECVKAVRSFWRDYRGALWLSYCTSLLSY